MNKGEFKVEMIRQNDSVEKLADYLNITRQAVYKKINGDIDCGFTQPEIIAIKNRWNLSPDRLCDIFLS